MSERKYKGKVMVGKVVSDKMQKTVVVVVETRRRHPLYGKIITVRRRFKAHNEIPHAKAGDTVKIVESRALSRDKHWRVAEIIRTGEVVEMIGEKELESLLEKERTEKQARKDEERKRAAERLARLGGFESVDEMSSEEDEVGEFEQEYAGDDAAAAQAEGDDE
jgi:small subunit ribosomal protein S17